MPLELNGTTGVQGNSGAFVAGTAVASTSGTSINFTSIPSWVKRVTIMFSGVSTSGTSNKLIQLGDSGGIEITSYVATSGVLVGASTATGSFTTGYGINSGGAGEILNGSMTITTLGSNIWVLNGIVSTSDAGSYIWHFSGTKTLSATLDRVRITTVNGTDTFDAGTINILYE